MKEMSLKERRLFFFSFITMVFGMHFMFHVVTQKTYHFPWGLLSLFLVYLFPHRWQIKVTHFLLSIFEPLGRFNSTLMYGLIYYCILYPISLIRGSEIDLAFKDRSRASYLLPGDQEENNFTNPY